MVGIVVCLPRQLHEDMVRAAGITASEYTVIMNLSEAPNRELRSAWPAHVGSVRTRVLDHVPPGAPVNTAQALVAVASQLGGNRGNTA